MQDSILQQEDDPMTELPTIKHTGNIPADFTGVIYSDIGKNHYAGMVNGEWLRRKDHKVRWFKYEMEAGRAAYRELHKTL
jgi:hypothetical protein